LRTASGDHKAIPVNDIVGNRTQNVGNYLQGINQQLNNGPQNLKQNPPSNNANSIIEGKHRSRIAS
jgi:hypothetical protein